MAHKKYPFVIDRGNHGISVLEKNHIAFINLKNYDHLVSHQGIVEF